MIPPDPELPAGPVPATEPVFARRGASLALAVAGILLWIGAGALFVSAFLTIDGSEGKQALGVAAVVAGAACFLLSVFASVRRARMRRRVPVGALLLAPLILAGVAYLAYAGSAEYRLLRATPGLFYYREVEGALEFRDAAGRWRVPYDVCAPGHDLSYTDVSQPTTGFADVTMTEWVDADPPPVTHLRVHVAERRVECFGSADPPAALYSLRATIGRRTSDAERLTTVELVGDTLVHRLPTGETTRTVPSEADWRAFRAVLDSIEVETWFGGYSRPTTSDQTAWSVSMTGRELVMDTSGRGQFPGAQGETRDPQPGTGAATTPEFERFRRALERLSGQPFR